VFHDGRYCYLVLLTILCPRLSTGPGPWWALKYLLNKCMPGINPDIYCHLEKACQSPQPRLCATQMQRSYSDCQARKLPIRLIFLPEALNEREVVEKKTFSVPGQKSIIDPLFLIEITHLHPWA